MSHTIFTFLTFWSHEDGLRLLRLHQFELFNSHWICPRSLPPYFSYLLSTTTTAVPHRHRHIFSQSLQAPLEPNSITLRMEGIRSPETSQQIYSSTQCNSRFQWPRGLRRGSSAARLLRSWARIPPGAWMFVCCKCCVLPGRGLCDEFITRPEEP